MLLLTVSMLCLVLFLKESIKWIAIQFSLRLLFNNLKSFLCPLLSSIICAYTVTDACSYNIPNEDNLEPTAVYIYKKKKMYVWVGLLIINLMEVKDSGWPLLDQTPQVSCKVEEQIFRFVSNTRPTSDQRKSNFNLNQPAFL